MHQLPKRYCPGPCACSGWCMYTEEEWRLELAKQVDQPPVCKCPCHSRPDFYKDRACTACGHRAPYVCPV